jgi:hypothetical protein
MNSRQRVTALSLLIVAAVAVSAALWRPTGVRASSMTFARANHSATLLADGRVLVVGGSNATGAELYDPATDSWALTGSMRFSRSNHAAVRLGDGRVLIVGGSSSTRSAEIYDPATGRWSLSAPMEMPRFQAAATLLADGRVFVVGGRTDEAANEIYDPTADSWSVTAPNPGGPRFGEILVTALPAGRVLILGGVADTANTLEIYDLAGDSWQVIGLNWQLWTAQAAPLPDDRLLIVSGGPPPVALIFDPATNRVTPTSAPPFALGAETLTVLPDGSILSTGSPPYTAYPLPQDTRGAVYRPQEGRWVLTARLASARRGHTATLLTDGLVLLSGGVLADGRTTASAELYEIAGSFLDKQLFLPVVMRYYQMEYPTPGDWYDPTPTFVPTATPMS